MRILVAEDLEDLREILALYLRDFGGHTVVEAADGEQAWRLFQSEPFDYLVVNFVMDPHHPDDVNQLGNPFNGDEFARRVRKSGSSVPIAVRSASPSQAIKAFADIDFVLMTDSAFEIVKFLTGRDPSAPRKSLI